MVKLKQKLNNFLSEKLLSRKVDQRFLLHGYMPVNNSLCRVLVDMRLPRGVVEAQPISFWQKIFFEPEQNIFNVMDVQQTPTTLMTPQGPIPGVTIIEKGIWFKT